MLNLGKHFGTMHLCISQPKNNKLLMESIAKYFKNSAKVYLGRPNYIQINLGGVQLWENVIFKHFPLYGTKKI